MRRGMFIDPETDLIREIFIVEASRQEGFLNNINLDFVRPFIRSEIAINLILRDILGKTRVSRLSRSMWL